MPQLAGLTAQPLSVDIGYSRFDLALELQAESDALSGYFEYDLDLFDADSIDGFVEALGSLLGQALTQPDVPVLTLALPAAEAHPGSRRPAPARGKRRPAPQVPSR